MINAKTVAGVHTHTHKQFKRNKKYNKKDRNIKLMLKLGIG